MHCSTIDIEEVCHVCTYIHVCVFSRLLAERGSVRTYIPVHVRLSRVFDIPTRDKIRVGRKQKSLTITVMLFRMNETVNFNYSICKMYNQ